MKNVRYWIVAERKNKYIFKDDGVLNFFYDINTYGSISNFDVGRCCPKF